MGINLDDLTEKGDRYRENIKMIEKCFIKRISNPLYYNNTMYKLLAASEDAPFLKVVHEFSSDIIAKRRVLLKEELDERRKNQLADDDMCVNPKPINYQQATYPLSFIQIHQQETALCHAGHSYMC